MLDIRLYSEVAMSRIQATHTLIADPGTAVAVLAIRVVSLAETLDLVPPSTEAGVDLDQLSGALGAFASVGVGRRNAARVSGLGPSYLAARLREVLAAIEDSPLPANEWRPLTQLLGEETLAKLLGVSVSSVHRYRSGERPTPDAVAWRLHTVALIFADLAGSYNDFGIRRWFQRSRSALHGAAPAEILAGDWSPDDHRVQEVRALARSLLGSPAT